MASIPVHQPSRPRAAPIGQRQASASQSRESRSPVRSRSMDSQTTFVQKPEEKEEEEENEEEEEVEEELQIAEGRPDQSSAPRSEDDIKRCWICMSDDTEDTPETSPWRDPCPCALVAHEECLLEWIAEKDAPKKARNRALPTPKIECPQCRAEIQLSRPRDYIVDAVRGLERIGSSAVMPVSSLAFTSAMVNLSQHVGIHTIYAIFGAEDGNRLLEPLWRIALQPPVEIYAGDPQKVWKLVSEHLLDRLRHWRLIVGLPLITPLLLLSRTSLADNVLPVLPIVFFASQAHSPSEALDFPTWPPSASFAFAILPYVRTLYNAYYEKVWAKREKRWLEALNPRVIQQNEEDAARANGQNAPEVPAEEGNIFEILIDLDVWTDDWEGEEQGGRLVQEAAARQPAAQREAQQEGAPEGDNRVGVAQDNDEFQGRLEAAPRHLPQVGGFPRAAGEAVPAPVIRDGRNARLPGQQGAQGQQDRPAGLQDRANNRDVAQRPYSSPTGIAGTFLGALFFPTIAGLSGEALKLMLPSRWVTELPAHKARQTWASELLQKKWARSLIGGCLFVVCKDALLLYCRWKAAQIHKGRRVIDVDRSKGRGSFRSG